MGSHEPDPFDQASQALAAADLQAAFSAIRQVFREPDLPDQDTRLVQALQYLSTIGRSIAGAHFGKLVDAARDAPDDVEALYHLGFELIEQRLADVAVCVLTRAHRRAPGNRQVVIELVAALEDQGRNAEACALLRSEPELVADDFMCRYLLAFHAILAAAPDTARELMPAFGQPTDPSERFMLDRLTAMLARLDALAGMSPLDAEDLRGWHFALTGGALLHLSPYGFEEGMRGRYAFTQDSYERCAYGLGRLRDLLAAWGLAPPEVLCPPDPDSRVLALAAGDMLKLPVSDFTPDSGPGLVVAYDLDRLSPDTPIELLSHRPGQVLYAHAVCWTDPPPCAPDVAGYLYQVNQSPWGERLQVDQAGQAKTVPASEDPPEALAAQITSADSDAELASLDDPAALAPLWAAMAPLASARNEGGRRSPLWPGGPVKSNRFV